MRAVTKDETILLQEARRDPDLVLLDGFHAAKHALRFGADMLLVAAADPAALDRLVEDHAPDLTATFIDRAAHIDTADVPLTADEREHWTGVLGVARRPAWSAVDLGPGRVVLLESPRNPGNVGAVVRTAAASGAAGVVVAGGADPWGAAAIRGAAGLQFALPVLHTPAPQSESWPLPDLDRPLVALDPGGVDLGPGVVPADAVLAFGTERGGLTDAVLDRADHRVRIPMAAGVSSLNLAVSAGIVLYSRP